MATEAYFNGKRSLFQMQMKPISMADEAFFLYCISKIVRDKSKRLRVYTLHNSKKAVTAD